MLMHYPVNLILEAGSELSPLPSGTEALTSLSPPLDPQNPSTGHLSPMLRGHDSLELPFCSHWLCPDLLSPLPLGNNVIEEEHGQADHKASDEPGFVLHSECGLSNWIFTRHLSSVRADSCYLALY